MAQVYGYTSEMCQQAMVEELEELFRGVKFTGPEGEKTLNIYKQFIPFQTNNDEDTDTNDAPYPCIIVSETHGEIKSATQPQVVTLQIIFCVYDSQLDRQGYQEAVNIKEAILQHFARKPVFGGSFQIGYPREWDLSEDDTDYYYWGVVSLPCTTPNAIRNEEVEALI